MISVQIKKIVSFILTGIIFFSGNTITAAAQEQLETCTNIVEEAAPSMNSPYMLQEEIALPQNIGDSIILSDGETGKWIITLISEQESHTRMTYQVTEKEYIFEHDVLNKTVDAFKVKLACEWFENGDDSIIMTLNGKYEILNSLFSCEWIGSSYSDVCCTLDLKSSYVFGSDMQVRFSASILWNNPVSIYFATIHIL